MAIESTQIGNRAVQRLLAAHVAPEATDRELLHRFSSLRDDLAFEALVRRHGAMVLAVARRLLANSHDAEDVCQAVFLLLAQKTASRQWQPSVANWLHQTAHHLALKVRTSNARRDRREKHSNVPASTDPLTEMTGRELLAVLDQELLALPNTLRAPLVLCYLEGAPQDEAARRMGCPRSTLKKRLERGRHQLHAALVKRGVGFSIALLGAVATSGSAAVQTAFVRKTIEIARALKTGGSAEGVISSHVGKLLEGGVGMAIWNKFKITLAVLLVGSLITLAATLNLGKHSLFSPSEVAANHDTKPEEPPATAAIQAPKADPMVVPAKNDSIKVIVLDPQGNPVSGTKIHASIWTDEQGFKHNRDYETDTDGVARVELPKTFTILRLWASKRSFVELFANWEQGEVSTNGVPAEYTFHLEAATTASGRVLDEQGKPVVGAKVEVMMTGEEKQRRGDGRAKYQYTLAYGEDAVTTDNDGRWQIENLPASAQGKLYLAVSHSDFLSIGWKGWDDMATLPVTLTREGKGTVTLKKGIVVSGKVTDPDGHPIKDAIIIHGDKHYATHKPVMFATDADGRYNLPPLESGKTSLTVIAPGFAPQYRTVELKSGLPSQDFRVGAGKPIRLRIVDAAGKPVPKAYVTLMKWKGSESIYSVRTPGHPKLPETGIPHQAGADGVWEWPSAPDEPVKLVIVSKGFLQSELEIAGGSAERIVTLKANHLVTGTVVDAGTGKPIPSFTVIPINVFRKDFLSADRSEAIPGQKGRLEYTARRSDIPLRLRIEAPGYRSQTGPEFRIGEIGERIQTFRLQPSPPLTGKVLDPTGRPAAQVEVLLATPTEQAKPSENRDDHKAFTDENGRFTFPDPGEPWAVFAQSKEGAASAEFEAVQHDAGTLKLQPWGSVRGKFSDGGKPIQGATIFVNSIRLDGLDRPRLYNTQQVKTDTDGRFEFSRIPPGPIMVRVYLGPWEDEGYRSGPCVPVDLKPGGRVDLELGSTGAVLAGKVKLTGKVPADLDCNYSLNYLVRREPGVTPPPGVAELGFDARKGWRDAWHQSHEGLAYLSTLQNWFVKLAPDGSFRVSGVPPGEYDLAIAVYAKPSGCLVDPLARQVVRVTVSAADVTRGKLEVPETSAEVVTVLGVGDTPTVSFEKVDGKPDTFETVRGKYTFVHFWATWCGPCKKQMPELRKLCERFANRGVTALGLALDDDVEAWRLAVKRLDLPWAQGRVDAKNVPGISGVPSYWLLDPKGKLVAKADSLDELAAEIEKRVDVKPADR